MSDCKIPEIPFASGVDQNLSRLLSPIKETLDIWAGRIGNPLCRVVTLEDLLDEAVTVNIVSSGGGSGNDADAIHDDVASEILAVALKSTPVSADLLLIEDSADAYAKKRITVGTLGVGGGSYHIDGGNASSIYTSPQLLDGGSASG